MTPEEQNKCFALLSEYYPRAKELQSRTKRAAWRLALEEYDYEPVKRNIVRYASQNKYFPDVSDVLGGLARAEKPRSGGMTDVERMERMIRRLEEKPSCAQ